MSKRDFIVGLCLSAAIITSAAVQEKCPLNIRGAASTEFGFYLKNLDTDEVEVNINGTQRFVPASVTKAFTVASALSIFPFDAAMTTRVSVQGTMTDSILDGNLIISAIGDPTIESSHFAQYKGFAENVASAVRHYGIREITGRVIVQYNPTLEEEVPSGWMNSDLIQPYGTAYHALNYRDNVLSLNLSTGKTVPKAPNIRIVRGETKNTLKRRSSDCIYVGSKAKGALKIAAPDPSDVMIHDVAQALRQNNVTLDSTDIQSSGALNLVYKHKSPPLCEVMKSLMFRSDNLMAEGMLRLLSPDKSRSDATRYELSLWDARGLDTEGIYVEDGSGLSRNNRISPRFLADVLEWMYRSSDSNEYLSMFPRAGYDGTMKSFMVDTMLEGRMATKTGSMNGVQCYAGYLLDENGIPSHAIVVMVNGFTCNRNDLKKAIGNFIIEKING